MNTTTPQIIPATGSVTTAGGRAGRRRKFCPESGLMESAGLQSGALAALLRALLRPLAVLMAVGIASFVVRDLAIGPSQPPLAAYLFLALCGAAILLLFSPVELSLRQLRGVEMVLFVALTVELMIVHGRRIAMVAAGGDAGRTLSEWNLAALSFILLMATYCIFIPNSWQRAMVLVVPMALALPALGYILQGTDPAVAAVSEQVMTPQAISDLGLTLLLAAVISVLGTALITRFRSATFEAREANLYDLREKIGEGGMGEVWKAEHQTLARPTAIKIIRPDIVDGGNPERARIAIRRFEREARATAALRSPHTVEIYDFGVTRDGDFFYVMEYLDGIDLDTLVQQFGPLPANRAISLLRQACSSLADAHARGLVHRDIKPANIYTCRMGDEYDFVKVLDFGLVKEQRPVQEMTQLTADGLTTGTPAYMAPEMALQGSQVGPGTDIYSLGCVAYWLLTGKLVFEGPTAMAIVVEHVRSEPVAPSKRTELPVPPELDEIVLRCLAKDPADRFASMRELSRALAAVPIDTPWSEASAEEWWELHRPRASDMARAS